MDSTVCLLAHCKIWLPSPGFVWVTNVAFILMQRGSDSWVEPYQSCLPGPSPCSSSCSGLQPHSLMTWPLLRVQVGGQGTEAPFLSVDYTCSCVVAKDEK